METLFTLVISFIGTNLDDIFLLTILFSQVGKIMKSSDIIIGQYLGIGLLVSVSILGSLGLSFVPTDKIGWLGLVPIILGIKTWFDYQKEKGTEPNQSETEEAIPETGTKNQVLAFLRPQIFNVTSITIANGADNVGIYIPLFNQYSQTQLFLMVGVFTVMVGSWCFLGYKLANFPAIRSKLDKYKHIVVPLVFIGLGIFILMENDNIF